MGMHCQECLVNFCRVSCYIHDCKDVCLRARFLIPTSMPNPHNTIPSPASYNRLLISFLLETFLKNCAVPLHMKHKPWLQKAQHLIMSKSGSNPMKYSPADIWITCIESEHPWAEDRSKLWLDFSLFDRYLSPPVSWLSLLRTLSQCWTVKIQHQLKHNSCNCINPEDILVFQDICKLKEAAYKINKDFIQLSSNFSLENEEVRAIENCLFLADFYIHWQDFWDMIRYFRRIVSFCGLLLNQNTSVFQSVGIFLSWPIL